MDDQIRRLMTNQITLDRFQCPVGISQGSLCHSAVDTDIPGIITMRIVLFTVLIFLGAKSWFCIDSRTANQAGISVLKIGSITTPHSRAEIWMPGY